MTDHIFDRPLPSDERYDRLEIVLEPRYKTSGLSGDEWRVGARLRLWYKGQICYERFFTRFRTAVQAAPWFLVAAREEEDFQLAKTDGLCMQPGCAELAVTEYAPKVLFSEHGDRLDQADGLPAAQYRRRFCARHARRGDASREDNDENYVVLSGPGPDGAAIRPEDESPAGQLLVAAESIEQVPDAVAKAVRDLGRPV